MTPAEYVVLAIMFVVIVLLVLDAAHWERSYRNRIRQLTDQEVQHGTHHRPYDPQPGHEHLQRPDN